jgi:hypothetical protein
MIKTDSTAAAPADPEFITLQQFFTPLLNHEIDMVSPRERWRRTADRQNWPTHARAPPCAVTNET